MICVQFPLVSQIQLILPSGILFSQLPGIVVKKLEISLNCFLTFEGVAQENQE